MPDTLAIEPTQKKRTRYHHGNLPQALVAHAVSLVEEGGAEALTLREVARRVGVTHAAPYRHFKDKAALLAAIAEEGFVRLRKAINERRQQEQNAANALNAVGSTYLQFAREHAAHFVVMFSGEVASDIHCSLRASARRLADDLRDAVQQLGGRSDADSATVAHMLWAHWHGMATLQAGGWPLWTADEQDSLARAATERIAALPMAPLGVRTIRCSSSGE